MKPQTIDWMKRQLTKTKKYTERADGSLRIQSIQTKPGRTQRAFKDETDVNKIIAKYKKTGQWTHVTNKTGTYADMTEIGDYQAALQTTINAEMAFMKLPSEVRAKFENNPGQLIEFLKDEKNNEEAIRMGLRNKPTKKETTLEDINKTLTETQAEIKKSAKVKSPTKNHHEYDNE